jgi:hypothetical protein
LFGSAGREPVSVVYHCILLFGVNWFILLYKI